MDTKTKGNIGEAKVMCYLLGHGYNALVPWGENTRYYIVAEKNNNFIRIQVKTISMSSEGINSVPFYNQSRNGKVFYTPEEIDELWVYCPEVDSIYKIEPHLIDNKFGIKLRV